MNEDLVEQARRLLAAATPGPWQLDGPWWDNHGNSLPMITAGSARDAVAIGPCLTDTNDADLDLIVAAPTLIAALADALEAAV